MVTLSSWEVLLKGHKMLHKHYSKRDPPSQEGGSMQFLKLTKGLKMSPELVIILCKSQLQASYKPFLFSLSRFPVSGAHWFKWISPNKTPYLPLSSISLMLLHCKQGQKQLTCFHFCNRLFKHSFNSILFIMIARKTITRWLLITASRDWGSRPPCPGYTHAHAHTRTKDNPCHKNLQST